MLENTDRQFNELRKQINKQNEYFTKEIEANKQILEMKTLIKQTRNELASIGNRADQMEKRISDIKDQNREMMQKRLKH